MGETDLLTADQAGKLLHMRADSITRKLSSTFALLSGIRATSDLPRRYCHARYAAGARAYRIVSCSDRESFENAWRSSGV